VRKSKNTKNAFTLIELLAVIIILGILMIIAIPSVTTYINNSRKAAYVDTAKEIISGARNMVNEGKLEMFDTGTTYYLPVSCISTENGQKSPYGDFAEDQAFVLVTYDGKGYNYYWVSRDTTGQGVKDPVSAKELDEEDIVSDIAIDYIKTTTPAPETGKDTIKVLDKTNCKTFAGPSGGGTTPTDVAVYPTGKDKSTVVVGDIVTIGDEEFYVVSNDGTDLVLLAHYNLKVGNIYNSSGTKTGEYASSDTGYGLQSSDAKGWVSGADRNGTVAFSSTNYWNGKVGSGLDYSGSYCSSNTYTEGTECAYVYDANSNLKTYVDAYKTALEGMGATIKEARLMKVEEAYALGCGNGAWNCNNAPAFVKETSFWLGSARVANDLWCVSSIGNFSYSNYSNDGIFGVRPVIII